MTAKKGLTRKWRSAGTPEENLRRIATLRRREAEIKEKIKQHQQDLIAQLEEQNAEQLVFHDEDNGVTITGTLVRSSTVNLDDEALKKKVGANIWRKISTLSLDRKKLEVALQAGDVSDVDVAASSTITPKAPFVKVTVK